MTAWFSGLFSRGRTEPKARVEPLTLPELAWPDPDFVEWPLEPALSIERRKERPRPRWKPSSAAHAGVQVFTSPFATSPEENSSLQSWHLPEEGEAVDRKYVEMAGPDGRPIYVACREVIDSILRIEARGAAGAVRLRWLTLDHFRYDDEAATLAQGFFQERGIVPASMGMARLLLDLDPDRAWQILEHARSHGGSGGTFDACRSRVALARGDALTGVRLAALAIAAGHDDLWTLADDAFSWGNLHGASIMANGDVALRAVLSESLAGLAGPEASARRVVACASLAELAGDDALAASLAARVSASEPDLHEESDAITDRVRRRVELGSRGRLRQAMDARRLQSLSEDWTLDEGRSGKSSARWTNSDDDLLTLSVEPGSGTGPSDLEAIRAGCRVHAEASGSGLVEAGVVMTAPGPATLWIEKTLLRPALRFSAYLEIPMGESLLRWVIVSTERGTTGIREAATTKRLMDAGELSLESYENTWARDPYDPSYSGVDRSALRYMSDSVALDATFPAHPLSTVRREMRRLIRRIDF